MLMAHDAEEIKVAIDAARKSEQPTLICCRPPSASAHRTNGVRKICRRAVVKKLP
jgi:transketolase